MPDKKETAQIKSNKLLGLRDQRFFTDDAWSPPKKKKIQAILAQEWKKHR